jgi:cytochrome d ubiquinol oxidase subunit I
MGLALLLVVFKALALKSGEARYHEAAQFWARIFGINFVMGVVTGIPMEFQFGTNWARFSAYSGGVIGMTLAMEGMFAFFAESAFLGLFLFGEKRLSPRAHFFSAFMVFLGSWLSGYFIITTDAFMQHPVGHAAGPNGALQLADVGAFLLNPWCIWQYLHNMCASVVTASFVVAAVGAFWVLMDRHREHALVFLKVGVTAGILSCVMMLFPTGDMHGKMVARHQPVALAAMEGRFESGTHAEVAIIGQPDVKNRRLENPIVVPGALSYLAYGSFGANVKGLNDYAQRDWPDNIELLYFAYHIMAGLGTLLILVMGLSSLLLWRGKLERCRPMLWVLMLAFPFPYIATTAGWMSAELGRQPWLIYGLQRTSEGTSPYVSTGNVVFSTLGFLGIYTVLSILFLYLISKEVARGPLRETATGPSSHTDPALTVGHAGATG